MATFTYNINNRVEENIEYSTLVSKFENGVEQRRQKRANSIRTFKLTFTNATQTEFENVRDFFIARTGAYDTFSWTNPNDAASYTVRFVEDSFTIIRSNYQVYDFSLSFIQVL